MLRQQHRLKIKAKLSSESWQYKLLMAIPRNLVYVFSCIIIVAFLGMAYVVYTGKNLTQFMTSQLYINENLVVHPLFTHFKEVLSTIDEIPMVQFENMTSKRFYQEFLTNSLPVLVKDAALDWPAIEKWKDKEYLQNEFGGQSLLIVRLDKGNTNPNKGFFEASSYSRRNNFKDFMNKTQNGTQNGRFAFYIRDEMIVSRVLQGDFVKPTFITKILRNRLTGLTIWPSFFRRPEYKERERYLCVIKGLEEFRLVSPVFKQNIYSGVLEELLPQESPLDFFNKVNRTQFPLFDQAKVLSVVVPTGSCLYVPAYYWVQSLTKHGESTILNFEYESHSELSTLLFEAIDEGILED